jgi:hypothetical protein
VRQRSDNTSGLKGASRSRGRWQAQIQHHGKNIHLGRFDSAEEAHAAYVAAAQRLAGEFANDGHGCIGIQDQPKRWSKPSFEIIHTGANL